VSERLTPNGTAVFAIFDAAVTPPGRFGSKTHASELVEIHGQSWLQVLDTESPLPYADESCMAVLGDTPDEADCYDLQYVLFNHTTTPFFVRQDLRDTKSSAEYTSIAEDEHEQAVAAMLAALEMTSWWDGGTVEDGDGDAWTFQDAVAAWHNGEQVSIIDEPLAGEGDGPMSDCEAVDDEH